MLIVSKVGFSKSRVILWDDEVVSLEILKSVIEIRDHQSVGFVIMWVPLKYRGKVPRHLLRPHIHMFFLSFVSTGRVERHKEQLSQEAAEQMLDLLFSVHAILATPYADIHLLLILEQ